MRKKRDLLELKKSEFVNLSELSRLSDLPYNTLVQYQRRFNIFPSTFTPEGKEPLYNRVDCIFIIRNFLKLKKKGFQLSFVKDELLRTKKRYSDMWQNEMIC